jgi:hypothetical protein
MTIDELIELATEAREDLGGDAQVRIAYQRGYPLRAALSWVTIPYSTEPAELYGPGERAAGQQHDGTFLWLATGTSQAGRTPTPPNGPDSAPASPQKSSGDKQHRKAPGLLPLYRSRRPCPGRPRGQDYARGGSGRPHARWP